MELENIKKEHLENRNNENGGQIVIVDFDNNKKKCLTFLVDDIEKPNVPGFPAVSLSYFNTVAKARKEIIKKYRELNYNPKNNCHLYSFIRKYDLRVGKTKGGK
jgi:uncharacterized UPF0146 family protein